MHAVHINFVSDPLRRPPSELLHAWWALVDIAEAPTTSGVRVSVVVAAAARDTLTQNNVTYHFLPAAAAPFDTRLRPALAELLNALDPDVLHVHGLGFTRHIAALAELMPHVPIVLQDHADRLPRFWRRGAWRRAAASAAGVLFCTEEQATPFKRANLLKSDVPIHAIPESTSRFTLGEQAGARSSTGIYGAPCVLWVGHLNRNKDPLTVLDGVSLVTRQLPDLHLWCCYGNAPLLRAVSDRVSRDPALADRVHLLGKVTHDDIQALMRAADMFVLGSHREGSGFSLIEALACGLVPVVTDIPSFRSLTGDGTIGRLWQCGNASQLASALLAMAGTASPNRRMLIRSHFDRHLSMAAVGRRLASAYRQSIDRHRARAG